MMNEPYSTTDLGQAAYVLALGYKLLRVDDGAEWRKVFVFVPEATAHADGYWGGATVPARAYFHALRDLKGILARGREREMKRYEHASNTRQ
jgi:hypothetical protein